jgi:hypothetical protein
MVGMSAFGTSATSRDVRVKSEMRTKTEVELPLITRILGSNWMSALAPRFEAMQTVDEDEATHRAAPGWCLLSVFQNTLRDLFDG